jgi:hypothetical protein
VYSEPNDGRLTSRVSQNAEDNYSTIEDDVGDSDRPTSDYLTPTATPADNYLTPTVGPSDNDNLTPTASSADNDNVTPTASPDYIDCQNPLNFHDHPYGNDYQRLASVKKDKHDYHPLEASPSFGYQTVANYDAEYYQSIANNNEHDPATHK